MSISSSPSIFAGEKIIQLPDPVQPMDLSKVYAQNDVQPDIADYHAALDASESQRSTNTTDAQVYSSAPVLQEVPVAVEIPTLDFKKALLFLGIGLLTYKYIFKKR